jgi:hypothetical protein
MITCEWLAQSQTHDIPLAGPDDLGLDPDGDGIACESAGEATPAPPSPSTSTSPSPSPSPSPTMSPQLISSTATHPNPSQSPPAPLAVPAGIASTDGQQSSSMLVIGVIIGLVTILLALAWRRQLAAKKGR